VNTSATIGVVVSLLVIALTACTPSRPDAATALKLAKDATPLLTLCAEKQSIDQARWPSSFASAGVESAYIGYAGLYIETDRVYVQESGVFLPCNPTTFVLESITAEDPAFLEVGDGVFTYFIAG
jgi:hypothetical protein